MLRKNLAKLTVLTILLILLGAAFIRLSERSLAKAMTSADTSATPRPTPPAAMTNVNRPKNYGGIESVDNWEVDRHKRLKNTAPTTATPRRSSRTNASKTPTVPTRQIGGDVHPGQDGMGGTGMVRNRDQTKPASAPGGTTKSKFKPPAPNPYDLKNVQVTSVRDTNDQRSAKRSTSGSNRTETVDKNETITIGGAKVKKPSNFSWGETAPAKQVKAKPQSNRAAPNDETHTVGHDKNGTKNARTGAGVNQSKGQPTSVRKPKP